MSAISKKMNLNAIKSEINLIRKSLINFKFQKSTGQLEKTSEIKKARKKIASLKTLISQIKADQNA